MRQLCLVSLICLVSLCSAPTWAGSYSLNANDPTNAYDPPIPGYVSPDGNPTSGTLNPAFVGWATGYVNYLPTAQGVSSPYNDPTRVIGAVYSPANNNVTSLGDLTAAMIANGDATGRITLTFGVTIGNDSGPDFAAFENSFGSGGGTFAELGYVEVSSDGTNFARFPSVSLTPSAVGGYGTIDATNVYNLVGKHVNNYGSCWGTPFNLDDLANDSNVVNGLIDLNNINYVRIVDVPGDGSFPDSLGNPIYDAWLTYGTGGVDLDGVGVLNMPTTTLTSALASSTVAQGGTTGVTPVSFTASFSESVANFSLSDIVVTNGSATGLGGSGASWTFDVTPAGPGAVTAAIPKAVCQSTVHLGKQNKAATSFSFTYAPPPPVVGENGYQVNAYFDAPSPSTDPLVSFDWDAAGTLYYSTGDPSYGNRMSVWKYESGASSRIFGEADYYSGSGVLRVGDYVFFNESGDFSRFDDFYYYRYDPSTGAAPVNLGNGSTLTAWGLSTRTGHDLFVSAGGSSWSTGVYYTALDANGNYLNTPWVNICQIGQPSGPVAFDAEGNMYYAHGYASPAKVFRFTAAEVNAAIADPAGHQLAPDDHEWADLGSYPGATGMACDAAGNVILTATSFTSPSELRMYHTACDGANDGYTVLATYAGRLETVRYRDASIFVSCADGIFEIPMPPLVVSCEAAAGTPANASNVVFNATFTEAVTGVASDLSDFSLVAVQEGTPGVTPTLAAGSLQTSDQITYSLSVDTSGGFEGKIALDVLTSGSIVDSGSQALSRGFASCETFTVDTIAPGTAVMTVEPAYTIGTENAVAWTAPADAGTPYGTTSYLVACYTDAACTSEFAHAETSDTMHTFTGLSHGVAYWYRVQARDAAGNEGAWSGTVSSTQDSGVGPMAEITRTGSSPTTADTLVFALAFSEPLAAPPAVSNLSLETGSLAGALEVTGSGTAYTVTVTLSDPDADGAAALHLAGAALTDLAGNVCANATSPAYTVHNWHGLTTQPADAKLYTGDEHTFSVDGDFGPIAPTFQWKWNDGSKTVQDGPASPSWTLDTVSIASRGEYWCEMTYDGIPHESAHATLDVENHLEITVSPVDRDAPVGGSCTFSVETSGGYQPLKYFWKFNGEPIDGATTNSYTKMDLSDLDAGQYTIEILDDNSDVAVASATLKITEGVPITGITGLLICVCLVAIAGSLSIARRANSNPIA